MQDVELLSKIDSDEFIVDYVELQEKHDDLSIKYNDLLKKVESSAWEYVGRQFGSIHNSVIERILNDSNCSHQLGETLRKVLVKNEN